MYSEQERILIGCRKNRREAQKSLFDNHHKDLLGVCMRYCPNKSEAQDVLLEGFMLIFKKIKTYNGSGSLEAWMRRIMVNKAIDFYRKSKTKPKEYSFEDLQTEVAFNIDILGDLSEKDILKTVQELPPGYRMVFNLYAIEGYTHKEIASMLNISENTSKTQLMKARKAFVLKLEKLQMLIIIWIQKKDILTNFMNRNSSILKMICLLIYGWLWIANSKREV